jgi:hypothetical protein
VAHGHRDERDDEQQRDEQPSRGDRNGKRVHPSRVPAQPSRVGDGFVPER